MMLHGVRHRPARHLGVPVDSTLVTPAELSAAYLSILTGIVERRGASDTVTIGESHVALERPKNRAHGDWASNAAMQLAKRLGTNPRELATEIAGELTELDGVASVDVAGPGFINITLEAAAAGEIARTIVDQGVAFGHGDLYEGVSIDLEFVSANPTGPIHMGGVRWAAVGDSLARVFEAQGGLVTREYYFNDHGAQIDRFARSLVASALGEPTPEDGYGGAYIGEIAARVIATLPAGTDVRDLPRDEAQELFRREGVEFMFADIKSSLHDFGVDFDVYFHENSLHESKAVERAIERLQSLGKMYEAEGALWLRTTDFGDDRDRVVIKSDGQPAYIAGDLAYYLDKRERGFERNLIMLGADHHGYVGRMMAMCAAFGDEPGKNLEILIGQMVNLLKDGQPFRMSKRNGTIVSMEDLVDAVGVDAGRYALVRFASDTSIDIDLDLLTKRTNDTRSSTCSTPTPARSRSPATLRPRAWTARRSTRPCSRTRRRARSSEPSPSTRAWCARPPSSASRTASRGTSSSSPGCTTAVRLLPRDAARRRGRVGPAPHPTLAERRHRAGRPERPGPGRGERARAHVACGARRARQHNRKHVAPRDHVARRASGLFAARRAAPRRPQRPRRPRRSAPAAPTRPRPSRRSPAARSAPTGRTPRLQAATGSHLAGWGRCPRPPPTAPSRKLRRRWPVVFVVLVLVLAALVVVAEFVPRAVVDRSSRTAGRAVPAGGCHRRVTATRGHRRAAAARRHARPRRHHLGPPDVDGVPLAPSPPRHRTRRPGRRQGRRPRRRRPRPSPRRA